MPFAVTGPSFASTGRIYFHMAHPRYRCRYRHHHRRNSPRYEPIFSDTMLKLETAVSIAAATACAAVDSESSSNSNELAAFFLPFSQVLFYHFLQLCLHSISEHDIICIQILSLRPGTYGLSQVTTAQSSCADNLSTVFDALEAASIDEHLYLFIFLCFFSAHFLSRWA